MARATDPSDQERRQSARLRRDRAKKKLHELLSYSVDEDFCRMIWAIREIQTRDGQVASGIFKTPDETKRAKISSPFYIYPWALETLVNELLTTSKVVRPRFANGPSYYLNCGLWQTLANLLNALRDWEDGQDGMTISSDRVFHEMARIGHQQFAWQRGFLNAPATYRAAFLFGGPEARTKLEKEGASLDALMAIGLAGYTAFEHGPYVAERLDLTLLGLDAAAVAGGMGRLSTPLAALRDEATRLRSGRTHPAYAPSALRMHPLIRSGQYPGQLLSPLPELLLVRTTTGLYYDVVGGGLSVRHEIGGRFETYVDGLLSRAIPSRQFRREEGYRYRGNTINTPDILVYDQGVLNVVVECKATKMTYDDRFGEEAVSGGRGFEELAKGAFQVWRHFAHSRLGLTRDTQVSDDAIGMVVTLDPWFQMSGELRDRVLVRARALAAEKDVGIVEEDCRRIVFAYIEDIEFALLRTTDEGFFRLLQNATHNDRLGYMLFTMVDELAEEHRMSKPYPFRDDIGDILGWWRRLREDHDGAVEKDEDQSLDDIG